MQICISTRHGQISDQTQAKVRGKVEKLSRFFDRVTTIEVTIDLEQREAPNVDLRVSADGTGEFVARERSHELIAALDRATHKVEQQLRKHKERIQQRHRQPQPPAEEDASARLRPEEA